MEPDDKVNIHNWWVSPYFNLIISKANDGFPVSAAMFIFPLQQLPCTWGQPPVSSVLLSASFSQPTNRDSGTRPFGSLPQGLLRHRRPGFSFSSIRFNDALHLTNSLDWRARLLHGMAVSFKGQHFK